MKEKIITNFLPVKRVSPLNKHCFCGYFDKFPWDAQGHYLLMHGVGFHRRQPDTTDSASIIVYDLRNNSYDKVAETKAFCWQQGSMLQWLNSKEIIFNDREDEHFIARIVNIESGLKKLLSRPVYCLSRDAKYALSVNFSRLDNQRPGYGYPGGKDGYSPHSDEDGIYLIDIDRNKSRLIISYNQIVKAFNRPEMNGVMNWFNHLLFNPSADRFAFFHRWRLVSGGHRTHMLTSNIDGSDIYLLNPDDMSSHYTWMDDKRIICYSRRFGLGDHYYEYSDGSQAIKIIGDELFNQDGHCSFSPNLRWMLTDTYPRRENNYNCSLILYDAENRKRYDIGLFKSDADIPTPARCDLHPKWSRDGRYVCVDSVHEGFRGVYVLDLSEVIASAY